MSNANTRTNKRAQACWYCGGWVPAGEGRLFFVQDDDEDEFDFQSGWLVEHLDGVKCQAAIKQAQVDAAAAEQRKLEQAREREELRTANEAAYAAWKAENLAGLVENNMYPWPADATFVADVDHRVYKSPELTGWYTTGDTYYASEWRGERFLVKCYGNAIVVYQSLAMREAWFRARWEAERSVGTIDKWTHEQIFTPAVVAANVLTTLRQYRAWFGEGEYKVLGGDYYEWLRDNVSTAELVALAKAETHTMKVSYAGGKEAAAELERLGVPVVRSEAW